MTAPRVRWRPGSAGGNLLGYVGTLPYWSFQIFEPGDPEHGQYKLMAQLPGVGTAAARSSSLDELKEEAEGCERTPVPDRSRGQAAMTKRIRWERNDDGSRVTPAHKGYVGTIGEAQFFIFEPDDRDPWWILTSSLPGLPGAGQAERRAYGDDTDKLKAEAERWLERFTASLGAIFPEAGRVAVDKAALDVFISEANATRAQRDQEFCCTTAEYRAADAEFEGLVDALNITAMPETSALRAGEKE
jgi:hypothetical protein